MITIDTSDQERAIRIARMTAKCDCQEKGGDIKNHFATILCDNHSRLQKEIAELRSDLEFMCEMSNFDGVSRGQYKRIETIRAKHNKKLLNKNDN